MRRGASYSLSSPRMHADRSEGALPYPGNPRSPQQSERRDGMAVGWSGGDGEGTNELQHSQRAGVCVGREGRARLGRVRANRRGGGQCIGYPACGAAGRGGAGGDQAHEEGVRHGPAQ